VLGVVGAVFVVCRCCGCGWELVLKSEPEVGSAAVVAVVGGARGYRCCVTFLYCCCDWWL